MFSERWWYKWILCLPSLTQNVTKVSQTLTVILELTKLNFQRIWSVLQSVTAKLHLTEHYRKMNIRNCDWLWRPFNYCNIYILVVWNAVLWKCRICKWSCVILCECRDKCYVQLRELCLRVKSIDSQQKTLMSNIDDDIYVAVKDVYDKVHHFLFSLLFLCSYSSLVFFLHFFWNKT